MAWPHVNIRVEPCVILGSQNAEEEWNSQIYVVGEEEERKGELLYRPREGGGGISPYEYGYKRERSRMPVRTS